MRIVSVSLFLLIFLGCNDTVVQIENPINDSIVEKVEIISSTDTLPEPLILDEPCRLEKQLILFGLVNIKQLDTSIQVDLRYSGTNNFLNTDLYDSLENCYLQPDVAEKLVVAQQLLKKEYPDYNLKIYDGIRPRSVQRKMWNILNMPTKEKIKYVSNPANGSLHNYGAAVDLTVVNAENTELDMGTDYDFFGELAYPRLEQKMLAAGKLNQLQLENRMILRRIMKAAGFMPITTEWWHFNSCYRKEAKEMYKIIE